MQGIDYYAAACAPHITNWDSNPRLRGPYDFLRKAKNNHVLQGPHSRFDSVVLDNRTPARVFVVAAHPDVRTDVAAAMAH